jgi:serine phosphatase RsbU (regulator of sigma subunit)/anti-sigma regulatory factor (Ser/Thr protein kinase)/GTP-sensing pleiotropic transcriptional regulator CodY
MGTRAADGVGRRHAVVTAALAILLGVASPGLATLIIAQLRTTSDFSFLFLYLPGSLFISYLGGLFAGTVSAVVSTALALHYFVDADGLALATIGRHGLPASLFLLTGTLIAIAGDQYRNHQAQLRQELQETARRAQTESLLVRVTDILTPGADARHAGEAICAACAETFHGLGALVLASPGGDDLRLDAFHAAAGMDPAQARAAFERLLVGGGAVFSRHMLSRDEPVVFTRAMPQTGPTAVSLLAWLEQAGVDAAVFAPLRAGDERLGYLVVATVQARWQPGDPAIVQSVADRQAASIDLRRRIERRARAERNAQLLAESMIDFFEEQTLQELLDKVTRRCVDVLGESCAVSLLDATRPTLRIDALHHRQGDRARRLLAAYERAPLPRDHPLAVRVLEGQAPAVFTLDDPMLREHTAQFPVLQEAFAHLGVRGAMAVPIRVGGETLGILSITTESARGWEAEDLQLATGIADRAGAAIANLRLIDLERRARQGAERETRRLNAINRVIPIAAKSLDLGEVFDEFAEALQLLLPFDRITVSLAQPDRDLLTTPYFKGPRLGASPESHEGPKAGTARGWVIDTGHSLIRQDTQAIIEFDEDHRLAAAGIRSYVVVPMTVGGRVVGTLDLGHHEAGFYTEDHVRIVQPVADHLAITVSHSQLFEQVKRRAGELSEALQRALLPADMPRAPFAALGALYRPADPETKIGGDWYDAFLLPDDSLLVSIGDISGRGLPAATAMGQVRYIIRAYALEGRAAGETLSAVNEFVSRLPDQWQLSVWMGIVDSFGDELRFSSAGHPPPLLMEGDRIVGLDAPGPPLGFAPGIRYTDVRRPFRPGSRLVLYTDGLTEATRDVLEGERRLAEAAAATRHDPPDRAVGTLLDHALRGATPHDDVVVLVLDALPEGAPLSLSLPAVPENLWRVRRGVAAFARRQGIQQETIDGMIVAVGEATLNVVEHAYRGRRGRMMVQAERLADTVIVTVRDFGRWRSPAERGRGRGQRLIRGFADTVKSTTGPSGTTVTLSWRVGQLDAALS